MTSKGPKPEELKEVPSLTDSDVSSGESEDDTKDDSESEEESQDEEDEVEEEDSEEANDEVRLNRKCNVCSYQFVADVHV